MPANLLVAEAGSTDDKGRVAADRGLPLIRWGVRLNLSTQPQAGFDQYVDSSVLRAMISMALVVVDPCLRQRPLIYYAFARNRLLSSLRRGTARPERTCAPSLFPTVEPSMSTAIRHVLAPDKVRVPAGIVGPTQLVIQRHISCYTSGSQRLENAGG
jgi:hypothetical protein